MFNESFFNLAGSMDSRQWAYNTLKYASTDAQKESINTYVTNGTPLPVSVATGAYGLLEKFTFLKIAKAFKGTEDELHTSILGEKYPMGGKAETFACDVVKGVYLDTVLGKNVDQFALRDQASKVTRSGEWDAYQFATTSPKVETIMEAFASQDGITKLLEARAEAFVESINIRREAVAIYKMPSEIKKEFLLPKVTIKSTDELYKCEVANLDILIDRMTRRDTRFNEAGFMRRSSKDSLHLILLPENESLLATNVLPFAVHDGYLGFKKQEINCY